MQELPQLFVVKQCDHCHSLIVIPSHPTEQEEEYIWRIEENDNYSKRVEALTITTIN